jgi:hypothetical protein
VDPTEGRHLALRSNFGLMLSHDAGVTWDWRCKAGMGYRGRAEPALAILNGGTLVLGVSNGVVAGDRAGCDFRPASGIDANVVDVVALPETAGAALAVSVSFEDSSSRVWRSLDDGRSFRAVGATLTRFTALSLGVPATSRTRVYMTGLLWGSKVEGAFAVSDDGGKTFAVAALAESDSGSQPFIAAVHPGLRDTIYVRLTGTPGRLRVSEDGGRTFREVLSVPGPLQAFATSPEGDRLFASSLEAGTYSSEAASLTFERVACEGVPCLAATGTALLGCGESGRHGFLVGRSVDEGRHFGVLLDPAGLTPARCVASTSVGAVCGEEWPRIAATIGRKDGRSDGEGTRPFSRACLDDGGGVPGRAGEGKPLATHATAPDLRARRAGCGCEVGRGGPEPSDPWIRVAALLLATIAFRRSSSLHGERGTR